jgi:hypothetical protein
MTESRRTRPSSELTRFDGVTLVPLGEQAPLDDAG